MAKVVAPLTATALGLGLGTGTAGAAVRSRTDTFTFTNRAGASVTCTMTSVQDLSETGRLRVSTTLSGPADCTASSLSISVQWARPSDGAARVAVVEGEGRSISATLDDIPSTVRSGHGGRFPACECNAGHSLSQSK